MIALARLVAISYGLLLSGAAHLTGWVRMNCEKGDALCGRDGAGRWCILRTSGGRTIPLATSLTAAGFDVWTPREEHTRRRPRSTKTFTVVAPIVPTFVFARERHLGELALMLASPFHQHPRFSIFQHAGQAPLVSDASLGRLRAEEQRQADIAADKAKAALGRARAAMRRPRREMPIGQRVKVDGDGGFTGLTGIVESSDGRRAMVNFGGNFAIEVDTWRLLADELSAAAVPA